MIFKKDPKILIIIPARGGSKGLKKKNIYPIGKDETPMLGFTIHAIGRADVENKSFYVCSDDDEIIDYAKMYCNIIRRPKNLSGDNSTIESVISFAIEHLKHKRKNFDLVMLLQPTSPLRTGDDIETALNLYLDTDAISLVSVCMADNASLKQVTLDKRGYIKPISKDYVTANRQALPSVYKPNGAIYITTIKDFMKTGSLFSEKTIPYLMETDRSVDVDTLADIKKVEEYLKTQNG